MFHHEGREVRDVLKSDVFVTYGLVAVPKRFKNRARVGYNNLPIRHFPRFSRGPGRGDEIVLAAADHLGRSQAGRSGLPVREFGRSGSWRAFAERQSVIVSTGFFSCMGTRRRGAEKTARGRILDLRSRHQGIRPQRGATAVLARAKKFRAKRRVPGPAATLDRGGGLDGALEREDRGRVALREAVATAQAAARRLKAREEEEVRSELELG